MRNISQNQAQRQMKTLYLPLKAHWYDMIESGVKTEEYREIKDYWIKRICPRRKLRSNLCCADVDTDCTHVCFSYGYTKRRMTYDVKGIYIGRGKPEWGAPEDRNVFVIKLGKKI